MPGTYKQKPGFSISEFLINNQMRLEELESFNLDNAIKFNDELNPKIWKDNELRPIIRQQLLKIAEDFVQFLGVSDLAIEDITISGSNAAYTYTAHSDLDLHVIVDMNKLPNNEVYSELFKAKKTIYNEAHDITLRGVPIELYVQPSDEPVKSLGEYSVMNDHWIKFPVRARANFSHTDAKMKYEHLGNLVELALKTKSLEQLDNVFGLLKRYRKAGLEKRGEFSSENLVYKALRSQGLIDELWKLKTKLRNEKLSLGERSLDPSQKDMFPDHDKVNRENQFKKWFGTSTAVNNKNKPKTLYHATIADFDQFRSTGTGTTTVLGLHIEHERSGIFLAENPKFAETFIEEEGSYKTEGRVIPVYLSAQKTIDLRDNSLGYILNNNLDAEFAEHNIDISRIARNMYEDSRWELFDGPEGTRFIQSLKNMGYDSAIIAESNPNSGESETVWVAFSPNQVKSAIGNRGSFSKDDDRLLREQNY